MVAQHHFELTLQRPGEGGIPPHVWPEQDVPGVCTDEYLYPRSRWMDVQTYIYLYIHIYIHTYTYGPWTRPIYYIYISTPPKDKVSSHQGAAPVRQHHQIPQHRSVGHRLTPHRGIGLTHGHQHLRIHRYLDIQPLGLSTWLTESTDSGIYIYIHT